MSRTVWNAEERRAVAEDAAESMLRVPEMKLLEAVRRAQAAKLPVHRRRNLLHLGTVPREVAGMAMRLYAEGREKPRRDAPGPGGTPAAFESGPPLKEPSGALVEAFATLSKSCRVLAETFSVVGKLLEERNSPPARAEVVAATPPPRAESLPKILVVGIDDQPSRAFVESRLRGRAIPKFWSASTNGDLRKKLAESEFVFVLLAASGDATIAAIEASGVVYQRVSGGKTNLVEMIEGWLVRRATGAVS